MTSKQPRLTNSRPTHLRLAHLRPTKLKPAKLRLPKLKRATLGLLAALCLLPLTTPAHAQGCSQCRETIGQTPARTQSAYRKGILLLVLAGTCVFATTLLAIRRFR